MKLRPKTAISEFFSDIEDPRVERRKRHKLIDIITITICAVISGIEHWTEIQSNYKDVSLLLMQWGVKKRLLRKLLRKKLII